MIKKKERKHAFDQEKGKIQEKKKETMLSIKKKVIFKKKEIKLANDQNSWKRGSRQRHRPGKKASIKIIFFFLL